MKKRIVVLGAGESGVGAAILAQRVGYEVWVSDSNEIKPKYKEMLEKYNIAYEEKNHSYELILKAIEVVKSPGIPEKAPIMKAIRGENIPVLSEIEFASRYTSSKKICITGSNGKTTTTMLTYHLLKGAGFNVGLAGNVGQSFALQVAINPSEVYVIELSSFQLDDIQSFKPEIAILLNITPDHMDRYNYDFQNYIDAKFRITENQNEDDFLIYCADDEVITKELNKRKLKVKLVPFSIKETMSMGGFLAEQDLTIITNNQKFQMNINELALQGKHNIYNSLAAGIAGRLLDIRNEVVREKFKDFENVEHRLEKFIKVRGVQYINDSKATNVNSVWYALDSMSAPVVWIAGGIDKGNNYQELMELVTTKVKALICLGTDNSKLKEAFEGKMQVFDTHSIEDAVKTAYFVAEDGDVVLLSPACASFDLFQNYEDRGTKFKEAVRNL